MNAVALTDHGSLYGAIESYRDCQDAGLNPIMGSEVYVAPGKRIEREARRCGEAACHLTLLAKNRTGFHNLVKMAFVAFLEGYHSGLPIVLNVDSPQLSCVSVAQRSAKQTESKIRSVAA
jgi:DNA polymerase III alpha subunit